MIALIEEAVLLKITKACNKTLAELIQADNSSTKQLLKLDNKTIKIIIKHLPLVYLVTFTHGKLVIQSVRSVPAAQNPDLTITVSPINLIKIKLTNTDIEQALRSNDIEFNGNLNLAIDLQKIVDKTEVNFREILQAELAGVTSDVFSWQVIRFLDYVLAALKIRREELALQITEYLQTETRLLVAKPELEEFYDSVDKIRDDVERLSARIRNLT